MNQKLHLEVEGKIIDVKEIIDQKKKVIKIYVIYSKRGFYQFSKIKNGIKIEKGIEGLFGLEFKLTYSEDKNIGNIPIYFPYIISAFRPGIRL